ncbi:hypothetical protein Slin_3974 [Spirosoma linguale DSM 74]|uniref:Uncharacterized protein n=1 Tax=Spirosoma linguale (strain ATCC 33905 / DSM 74 / LMG 10896 / Claus 1) TaxID=504472 RepID=D2QIN8_SPILD|nr:hypothetical protein Slin_3974 [Spirosoma linguale DSM 74]
MINEEALPNIIQKGSCYEKCILATATTDIEAEFYANV